MSLRTVDDGDRGAGVEEEGVLWQCVRWRFVELIWKTSGIWHFSL